ncbi:SWI/SNF-related matrix-associated actin-dependent regulator of chromatin subfamily A-like protein 1 homolog isoform X1 [Selaginella moellendorffii]|uniref:SWI/SNF-related matrix-associated actin-dependent regulator of chromatin subfamily A-like protein 1 homolog isoform X1 n=1 Tax=Selaginella moellendorffii TaxID=88036 RepID=UPI000D1CFB32|nr:SWI/SNF-related matrix-associated actin-dependent regulator of chromatin subfamily A-like protein 1 homolog isoform X1 [Selaginella moellendorffii]|eukprot:XP_024531873.1 SWI/SNF-related matrix-associated actin-dependent regulator of chromatin subfamily A-like protein 1 homolog isoform X1 [Selaginella moellendorffii]
MLARPWQIGRPRIECLARGMAQQSRSPLALAAASLGAEEWDLTTEEMDSMERNAAQELAARRLDSPLKSHPELLARAVEGRTSQQSPSPPVSPFSKRPLRLKLSRDGHNIAVEAPYNASLIAAYKSVAGHEWDRGRRLWLFPEHNVQELLRAVTGTPDLVLDVQAVPPLKLPHLNYGWNPPSCSGHGSSPLCTPTKSQDSRSGMAENAGSPLKELVVQIFLIDDNRIAARSPYNQNVKQACQSVTGKLWNNEERVWTYPRSSLIDLVRALRSVSCPRVNVEVTPPLILPPDQSFGSVSPCNWNRGESEVYSFAAPEKLPPTSDNLSKQFVKLFLHSTGLIAVKCEPSQKLISVLKSISKAFWNYRERLWMFPPCSLSEAEKAFAEVPCEIEAFGPLVRRALDFQRDVSDLIGYYKNIPGHLESSLMPFQQEGVQFALHHGGRALIADEMGLGKSVQAIAVVSCLRDYWPVLVIVPSSLRIHWATMLKTWLEIRSCDITIVLSQGTGSSQGYTIAHSQGKKVLQLGGLFNIISYDMVSKLPVDNFKVVIADESHYIKNAQAKRTNACVPIIQKAKYAVLLTGTPALSRPVELFKQLEALQPSVYSDFHEYGQRYCSGSHFGIYQGASNREELHALLKSTVMIRRLKNDVLSELPEKCREQVFLSLDMKSTRQLRALINELKSIREKMQNSTESETEKLKREEKVLITKIYAESAVVKVPAVQDYLSTMLETNCKFLVFAHHHTMVNGIDEHLKKKNVEFIRIDGDTSPVIRQSMVDKFQNNEKVRAAVLSIRAAGLGLTLTSASTVIFAEMTWTPGDLIQAEDRAHRIGQRSSVNIYYLHAPDTIDDFIWETIHRKLGNLGQVLNGREETMRVASPLQHRQRTINNYLRPCSRNLSEQYEKDKPGTSAAMESSDVSRKLSLGDGKPVESSPFKRPKLL